jgi:hypothetical protein
MRMATNPGYKHAGRSGSFMHLQIFQPSNRGVGTFGQIVGIKRDPPMIIRTFEIAQQVIPFGIAATHGGRLGAAIGAGYGIARSHMPNVRAQSGEDFIEIPDVAKNRGWIEIDAEPRASCGCQRAIKRSEG